MYLPHKRLRHSPTIKQIDKHNQEIKHYTCTPECSFVMVIFVMVKWRKDYSYSYIRKSQVCGSMFCLWYAMHTDENTDDHGDVKGRGSAKKLYSVAGLLR